MKDQGFRMGVIPTAQTTDLFCAGIWPVVLEDSVAKKVSGLGRWYNRALRESRLQNREARDLMRTFHGRLT